MSEELFSNPEQQTPTATPTPAQPSAAPEVNPEPVDPSSLFANQLAGIVTDDGRQKYADVNTALASIPHAQSHISELTSKLQQAEEELARRSGMEELVQQLQPGQAPQSPEQPTVEGLDANQVAEVVDTILQQKTINDTMAANASKVKTALSSKFGDKAKEVFAQKATSLGMTTAALTELAKTSPSAALQLFADAGVNDAPPSTASSVTIPATPTQVTPTDYMAKFKGTATPLDDKWNRAKAAATQTLNGE